MSALLVGLAAKATLVLATALLLDRLGRRLSAADRHLLWTVAVGALLLLPPATAALPSLGWPALPAAGGATGARDLTADPGRSVSAAVSYPGSRTEEIVVLEEDGSPAEPPDAAGGAGTAREDPIGSEPPAEGAWIPVSAAGPWVGLAWAAGAAAVLLHLLLQAARCARIRRRSEAFGAGRVHRTARRVARELGLERTPELLRGPPGAMPSTWGVLRHRLLLPGEAASWPEERLGAVLAHEMAHVRRRDGLTQLLAALACALYWYHPMAWGAARRMASQRELACDDEVLRAGARPSGYARSLVEVARQVGTRPLAGVVATSMARPGGLGRRVDSVLAADRSRVGLSARRAGRFGLAGALVLLPVASLQPLAQGRSPDPLREPRPADAAAFRSPGPAATGRGQEADRCWVPDVSHSMNVHRSDGEHRLRWEGEGCVSEILVRGTPTFDADFDRITGLSEGGLVRIEETVGGERRAVEVRPDGEGGMTRTFRREGRLRQPTEEDRAWIAARVVTLLRQTGLVAGERVAWILSREGPEGVFREVERISADRGQALYLEELLARSELDDAALDRLLRTAGDRIGSDGRLSALLERVAASEPARVTGTHAGAFRAAASTVGSDGDLRRALTRMVWDAGGDPAVTALALEIGTDGIGSDGDMASFLVAVARTTGGELADPELRRLYLRAVGTVGSDGDERRARLALERAIRGRG